MSHSLKTNGKFAPEICGGQMLQKENDPFASFWGKSIFRGKHAVSLGLLGTISRSGNDLNQTCDLEMSKSHQTAILPVCLWLAYFKG